LPDVASVGPYVHPIVMDVVTRVEIGWDGQETASRGDKETSGQEAGTYQSGTFKNLADMSSTLCRFVVRDRSGSMRLTNALSLVFANRARSCVYNK
jgi:hypothetical protein